MNVMSQSLSNSDLYHTIQSLIHTRPNHSNKTQQTQTTRMTRAFSRIFCKILAGPILGCFLCTCNTVSSAISSKNSKRTLGQLCIDKTFGNWQPCFIHYLFINAHVCPDLISASFFGMYTLLHSTEVLHIPPLSIATAMSESVRKHVTLLVSHIKNCTHKFHMEPASGVLQSMIQLDFVPTILPESSKSN